MDKQHFNAEFNLWQSFRASVSSFLLLNAEPAPASRFGRDKEAMARLVTGFERWCRKNGLRTAWYRVPQNDLAVFEKLGKKALPVGEDATVNLDAFTLQGSDKKSLRNVVNRLGKEGYSFHTYDPPHRDNFLQQLRAVSNEWLQENDRQELVFSQGIFDEEEVKNQPVFTVDSQKGKIQP